MKPDRDTITVESTLEGEDIEMGLDLTAIPHLMSVMTDLYPKPKKAVIREYSTNAYDANVEAGYDGPIRVGRPTQLRPVLTISDNGPGLDVEDIRNIYSKYGASTKRDSNEAVGMLGLGSKSALTYTDQFTVESVKDGQRATVSVSRNDDGSGVMKVLSVEATDDESGTTISIPVKHGDAPEFEKEIDRFFRFWEPGTVEVNGVRPDPIEGYELTPDLMVVDGTNDDDDETQDLVVMGNVAYPTDLGIFKDRGSGRYVGNRYVYGRKYVVARVPIGSVNFTPDRESLLQSKRTDRALEKVKGDFAVAASNAIERDVAQAKSKPEAIQAYYDAAGALDLLGDPPPVKFQGEQVPTRITYKDDEDDGIPTQQPRWAYRQPNGAEVTDDDTMRVLTGAEQTYKGSMNDNRRTTGLGAHDLTGDTIWITNFFPTKFNADQRRRIDAYRKHKGLDAPQRFVLVRPDKVPMPDWVNATQTWDWKELRKWRDPATPQATGGGKKRVTGSYYVRKAGGSTWSVDEVAADQLPTKQLYWMRGSKYEGSGAIDALAKHAPKAHLVVLPNHRIDKFKREFPHAGAYSDEVRAAIRFAAWDKLTAREQALLTWHGTEFETTLNALDMSAIDDPDLAALVAAVNDCPAWEDVGLTKHDLLLLPPAPKSEAPPADSAIRDRYPILAELADRFRYGGGPSRRAKDDLILYLNAAYAARQKENA